MASLVRWTFRLCDRVNISLDCECHQRRLGQLTELKRHKSVVIGCCVDAELQTSLQTKGTCRATLSWPRRKSLVVRRYLRLAPHGRVPWASFALPQRFVSLHRPQVHNPSISIAFLRITNHAHAGLCSLLLACAGFSVSAAPLR